LLLLSLIPRRSMRYEGDSALRDVRRCPGQHVGVGDDDGRSSRLGGVCVRAFQHAADARSGGPGQSAISSCVSGMMVPAFALPVEGWRGSLEVATLVSTGTSASRSAAAKTRSWVASRSTSTQADYYLGTVQTEAVGALAARAATLEECPRRNDDFGPKCVASGLASAAIPRPAASRSSEFPTSGRLPPEAAGATMHSRLRGFAPTASGECSAPRAASSRCQAATRIASSSALAPETPADLLARCDT
jgi:hypothetical protein